MTELVLPRGKENEFVVSIRDAGTMLNKAMDVPEQWNDSTYERFKENVVEPVSNAIGEYLKSANDMYENLEASVVIGEHIMKVCREEVFGDFSWPWILINWVRERMFPSDIVDTIVYNLFNEYEG